jgi:quinol-cytochrome oxidoreductase complex cytochrome b subunit
VSGLDTFKSHLITYINHFTVYDYVAYAWLILIFFLTILLSIFIAKKSPICSILIFLVSLALLFVAPFVIKSYLDDYLRPTQNKTILVKKLTFSDALVVTGEITNTSKIDYSTCSIDISVLKHENSYIKNIVSKLKPLRKKTISINELLEVNTTKELRVVFDNYTYNKDVNVSINSQCY